MKRTSQTILWLALAAAALPFASCGKDTPAIGSTAETPATVGTYTVSQTDQILQGSDVTYTMSAVDRLSINIFAQVMLTKAGEQNCLTMKIESQDGNYVLSYSRKVLRIHDLKVQREITTSDPNEIARWMLMATLEGHTVEVVYDERTAQWHGRITSPAE